MQIFHNTIMAGLIHKTITKAAKKGGPPDKQIKKLTFRPFPLQLSTTKHGKTVLSRC